MSGGASTIVPKLGCSQCPSRPARCSCVCLCSAELPGMEPHTPSSSHPSQALLTPLSPEPKTFYAPPVMTYELLKESEALGRLRARDAFYLCVGVILFYLHFLDKDPTHSVDCISHTPMSPASSGQCLFPASPSPGLVRRGKKTSRSGTKMRFVFLFFLGIASTSLCHMDHAATHFPIILQDPEQWVSPINIPQLFTDLFKYSINFSPMIMTLELSHEATPPCCVSLPGCPGRTAVHIL